MRLIALILLVPAVLLFGCSDPESEQTAESPSIEDATGPEVEPTVERDPNEVIGITPEEVAIAVVEDSLDTYEVALDRLELQLGQVTSVVDSTAVYDWLTRFGPLVAEGTYADLDPAAFELDYTSLVTLQFEDGSAETLYFMSQPDGLAVVQSLDGTVWRLAPEAYRDLVPTAAALRAR